MGSVSSRDLFLRACRGLENSRPPLWFMRQAGRYLPEYREIRAKHSMLEVIRTPELAVEVTLQPLRRFPLDAAIIFADILNPLIGLGFELEFVEGKGPIFRNRVTSPDQVQNLVVPPPEENVGYTLEALSALKSAPEMEERALIGFAGAPFTLSYYLIEGESKHNLERTKSFARAEPDAWRTLQETLTLLIADYLIAQVRAGADAVQLFDSWAWGLSPIDYREMVVPYLNQLISKVRKEVKVPFFYFAPAGLGLLDQIGQLEVDVVGIDWRISLAEAAQRLKIPHVLQGNLDPTLFYAPWGAVEPQLRRILDEGKTLPGHIFNLGHGMLPTTPPEGVARVVEFVHGFRYS